MGTEKDTMLSAAKTGGNRDLTVAYYHAKRVGSYPNLHVRRMHGPRRVITFCLLTAVLPTVLLVIPLYLRHSVYADVSYQVTESDVLKIVEGISSVFCQEHSLKMNSTFSAYQLESEPKLSNTKKHIHMKKSMKLPDDTLEYWGFYLLNGSTMVLSACSRFEGGRVMVVRGERNLKTCGLLDRNNKHQETHLIGGSGTNKVRITFENKHDVKPENNNSSQIAKVSPVTEKTPEDQKTAKDRKSFVDEDEIFIDNSKVSGELVERGGGSRGKGKEEENKVSGGGKSISSRKETEFDEEDDEEEEGGDEEDDDEEEGGDEEDDDDVDELEGSGEGEEDDLSVEQEIKKLMERLSERKKARSKGNKVIRHEKKHLKDLGISSDGGMNLREWDSRRRRRRNIGIDNGRGIDDGMARAEKFKRVERLRRELGEEVRSRRRKKREEMNLVDGGMKHGGTALNYTKRESEEDSESSFEMGLKECYGGDIEFQEEFSPSESCSEEVSNDGSNDNEDISNPSIRAEHYIKSNGYYYYIFYSDNDRVTNEVHAAFLINKTVYEYASSSLSGDSGVVCINATECTFPVGFLSGAIVMVEVPTRDGIDRNVMDEVGGPQGAILVSSCHPRMSVYIIFPIAVLFLILGCAFL